MWAINVVVVDVLGEQSMEVSLVDDDRVSDTPCVSSARRACRWRRSWRPDRCPNAGDAQLGQAGAERAAVEPDRCVRARSCRSLWTESHRKSPGPVPGCVEMIHALLVLAVVLFVLWLLFHATGGLINLIWIVIIVPVVLWLFGFVRGRSAR